MKSVALAVAGIALLGAMPAQAAAKPPRKTVEVGDNFFSPEKLTVKRRTVVVWRWPGADSSGAVHDVKLRRAPKGVRRFHSQPAATDYRFKRRLKRPGRYKVVCTFHPEMRMTIRVRRANN